MDKLNEIIERIQSSIQVVIDGLLTLVFQPVYFFLAIIESIINIWTDNDEETGTVQDEPQQQVTVYSSANDGRMGPEEEWDCNYPLGHIGFKINKKEQEELDKIKTELNLNGE